ncbi:MAG: putative NarL family two-component response regulator [Solirubrobacterales bacterium]|jgi:two-component system nitrate/nitrite response regulator NarL|nr:putative NarL family two-component response regulator [Solirubrobacterales bacterium]
MIRVLVVASVRLYRDGLAEALVRDDRVEVVGVAATLDEAVAVLRESAPDTVVLDVGTAGCAAARELTTVFRGLRVVALAVTEAPADVVEWAEAGAAGFVTHEGTVADLLAVIVGASHNELVCSPRAAGALLRRVRILAAGSTGDVPLTPREVEIARLVEKGLTNKEIATALQIELPTVKNHVHRILEKLGVRRRAEAAARVRAAGLALRD